MSDMSDWIQKQMKKGYSPRQIKEELVNEGYSLSTINSSFRQLDLTSMRNKQRGDREEENEEGYQLPSDISMRTAGAVLMVLALISISGVFLLNDNMGAESASKDLQGLSQEGIENHSMIFKQNERAILQADRELKTRMHVKARDAYAGENFVSTYNTTTKIQEGGDRLIIESEAQGEQIQDFEETRYAEGETIWNRRVNMESRRNEEMFTSREKGKGLEGVNYAGSPFSYLRIGNYDQLSTEGSTYVLEADSIRPESSNIVNYSSTLKLNSDGMIARGEATIKVVEDYLTTIRRVNYTAETVDSEIIRPNWINN